MPEPVPGRRKFRSDLVKLTFFEFFHRISTFFIHSVESVQGARRRHFRGAAFCQCEAQKYAEPFEARATSTLFQQTLSFCGGEVERVRDGMDQDCSFNFVERFLVRCSGAPSTCCSEISDALVMIRQFVEQNNQAGEWLHERGAVFGVIGFFE